MKLHLGKWAHPTNIHWVWTVCQLTPNYILQTDKLNQDMPIPRCHVTNTYYHHLDVKHYRSLHEEEDKHCSGFWWKKKQNPRKKLQ